MSVLILKGDKNKAKENFSEIFKKFNVSTNGRVLIKPNFSGRPPVIPGENTDPEILKKLIEFLIEKGVQEIIIAHGALLGTTDKRFTFDEIIKGGGFSYLYNMPKTTVLDIDRTPKKFVEFNDVRFSVPKILDEVDSYINFAKLKTHMEAIVTFALKNQMGLVIMGDRINMHKMGLEERIAYLGKLIKPNLSIVDGIVAMEGNGPHHGKSKILNLMMAGDDMVELDSVVSFLINLDFKKIQHIARANEIGVGNYPTQNYLDSIKEHKIPDFKLARKYETFGKNFYAWPTTGCSMCITALNHAGKLIKKHPIKNISLVKKAFVGNKRINFVIGSADGLELPKNEKVIIIGRCSKKFSERCGKNCLDKCPPSIQDVLQYIKEELK